MGKLKRLTEMYVTQDGLRAESLGLGRRTANKINLSETKEKRLAIVDALSKFCIVGQYPTNTSNMRGYEVWYWPNSVASHCTLTFAKGMPESRKEEIIQFVESVSDSFSKESWVDYHTEMDEKAIDAVALQFLQNVGNNIIIWNGKKSRVIGSYRYNDDNVAAKVMPIRNRKNWYSVDNLHTAFLAIDNGYA